MKIAAFFSFIGNKLANFFTAATATVFAHKVISLIVAVAIALTGTATAIILSVGDKEKPAPPKNEEALVVAEPEAEEEEIIEEEPVVEEEEEPTPEPQKPAETPKPTTPPVVEAPVISGTDYKYNTNIDINNNVFLDSLIYTGYNIEKHRSDGLMWVYILASQKRAKGWLSNIGYKGIATGYETTADGKPNIPYFEKNGLVCATYVTYVYFNYLPNVAGIDTSSLTKPVRSYSANDWYIAAKDWVNKGYSRYISFTANDYGSITRDINFKAEEDIPIGSIICLEDWYNRNGHCSHVSVYAGYANGYHWVYHVGNDNGPEFCAIERMNRKPDPQWPLAVITPPSNIRFSASLEVELKDDDGNPIANTEFTLKNTDGGKEISLGKTDANGKIVKDGLSYGDFELIETVPSGYTAENSTTSVKLTTENNSYNKVSLSNTKEKAPETNTQAAEPTAPPAILPQDKKDEE